jgi:hypothetical protein
MDEETEKDRKAKRQPTGDYGVGYCRPPEATQFKKGQSGNRKGRPKGTKNIATYVSMALQQRIAIREGGKVKRRTKADVVARAAVVKAMKGDLKALATLKTMERSDRQIDHDSKDNGGATGALLVGIPQGHNLDSFLEEVRKHQLELQAEPKIVNRPSDE